MGSLKNLPEHPEEGHSDPALREAPGLSECDVWDVDSDAHTDVKHDNRVVQGPALLSNVLIVDKLSKSLEGSGQAALPQITHVTTEQEQEQNQLKSLNPQMVDLEVDFSSTISSVSGSLQTETVNTCCAITGEEATDSALCTEVTQDSREQNKQEITILVTNHDFNVESEEEDAEIQKSPGHSTVVESIPSESGGQTESDNVSLDGSIVVASLIEISEVERTKADRNIPAEQSTVEEQCSLHHSQPLEDGCGKVTECGDGTNHKNLQPDVKQTADVISQQQVNMTEAVLASSGETGNGDGELKGSEIKDVCEQKQNEEKTKTGQSLRSAESVEHAGKKGPLSDRLTHSPGRQQHVQTQVSLEVMYQSVATSPMTPPEGSAAFLFPNSFGKFGSSISGTIQVETKDVEMQAGLQVESRSVATAPMSPTVLTAPEVLPEPRGEPSPEEPMEPVQEVRWDEKGMTWEVYGAVVEVAVLGTAIQKHLEKQVKKQHKPQPATTSEDTPDPNPADAADAADAADPLPSSPAPTSPAGHGGSTKGSGKKKEKRVKHGRRRQNPLRLLFRNTQQPSCCSRAHAD